LEQDLARLKARRKELIPDDDAWITFLPGIRQKITMREARRMSWMPVKRLAPIFVLMAVILFLLKINFPVSDNTAPLDGQLFGDAGPAWISQSELYELTELELYESDLYHGLLEEEDAKVLQVIDNWKTDGSHIIDQLLELTEEEQHQIFEQLEQGLL
jgi:hypothetical protein